MWSEAFVSDEQVIEEVWPSIEKLNMALQRSARMGKQGLVVARIQTDTGARLRLPKNSKGMIMREQAGKMFAEEISSAYKGASSREGVDPNFDGKREAVSNSEVMKGLARRFDEAHMDTTSDLSA
jgi:hypothetical protein